MTSRVLLVDDEKMVLDGFRRNLRAYDVTTAVGPEEGLRQITDNGPFAVVVTDLQMPGMDGITLLKRVESVAPTAVRIMLTGQADLSVSMAAVNEGKVFRFLTKPCPPDVLAPTLDAALEQYRLVEAERQLLEETLRGAVDVLTDVLGLVDAASQELATNVERTVTKLAEAVDVRGWQYGLAAMLSQLGNLTLPPDTAAKRNRGAPLSPPELAMAAEAPNVAYRLLARVPRLEDVAEMVRLQDAPPTHDPASTTS